MPALWINAPPAFPAHNPECFESYLSAPPPLSTARGSRIYTIGSLAFDGEGGWTGLSSSSVSSYAHMEKIHLDRLPLGLRLPPPRFTATTKSMAKVMEDPIPTRSLPSS